MGVKGKVASRFRSSLAKRIAKTTEAHEIRVAKGKAEPIQSSNTLNIGLENPTGGDPLSVDEVLQGVLDTGADVRDFRILQSGTEPTVVVRTDRSLSPEEGGVLSERLGQEAIAQRPDAGDGALFGPKAEEWGPFNEEYFLPWDRPGYFPEYAHSKTQPAEQFTAQRKTTTQKAAATRSNRNAGRLMNKNKLAELEDYVKKGVEEGADGWYHSGGIKDKFIESLGPEEGPVAFDQFMQMVSSTSISEKVPQNLRRASEFFRRIRQNEDVLAYEMPTGYGSRFEGAQREGVKRYLETGAMADPAQNPKTWSFWQNLIGNYLPTTIDRHFMRLIGSKKDAPSKLEYGPLEKKVQEEAARLGMTPSQYQAAMWAGGKDVTGVHSATNFTGALNRRIKRTAQEMGITEEEAARRFIKGDTRLRAAVPAATGMGALYEDE